MTIIVTIPRATIYDEVAKTTGYTGAKDNDTSAYKRLATTEADHSMLQTYYTRAVNTLTSALRHTLVSASDTGESLIMTLAISTPTDHTLQSALQSDITDFLSASVTAGWLAMTGSCAATDHAAKAHDILDQCLRRLYLKSRPVRPRFN